MKIQIVLLLDKVNATLNFEVLVHLSETGISREGPFWNRLLALDVPLSL
jgi:hypothetical protein